MLSQQTLYPEGFTFISPPASPSDIIPPATVQEQMGAYYPQTAQCTVQTFETAGPAASSLAKQPGEPLPEHEQRDNGEAGGDQGP